MDFKGFNDALKKLAEAPYYGFTIHEKIFAQDTFEIERLEYIPRSKVIFDRSKGEKGEWILRGNEEKIITEEKFLISTYNKTLEYPEGDKLLNYGLNTIYEDLIGLEAKVRALQEKYGAVIPVFGYAEDELPRHDENGNALTRDQILEPVKKRIEQIKGITATTALAIPVERGSTLKESFTFISLTDLRADMQVQIMDRNIKKIEKFIKGATFSEGQSGSHAKDQVQQSEKEKIEDDVCVFIRNELKKLIDYDGWLAGYDPAPYHFTMEVDEGEAVKIENDKKRAEVITEKVNGFSVLSTMGYRVTKSVLAKTLGISEADLEEYQQTSIGSEFSGGEEGK